MVQESHDFDGVQLGSACGQPGVLYAWSNSWTNKMASDVRHFAGRLGQQARQASSGTVKATRCREDDQVSQKVDTTVEIGNGLRLRRILTPLVSVLAGG